MGWRIDKAVIGISVAWVLLMGAAFIEIKKGRRFDPSFCGGAEYNDSLCFDPDRSRETEMMGLMVTVVPPAIFLLGSFLWNRRRRRVSDRAKISAE